MTIPPLFRLHAPWSPSGDQPEAIKSLVKGFLADDKNQVLLGVTGSGKTFTMAHVIQALQRPTLIMAPNKTLGAQLYEEMKCFFPDNAVEYFVSYYDYYQPEAYVPKTNTYIEKTAQINEQIDRMRHSATRSLLERYDTIVVASVSCIYGIGSVETYGEMTIHLRQGEIIDRHELTRKLVTLQYKRNDIHLQRGTFRVRGDVLEVFPAHFEDRAWRISFWDDEIESISETDALTGDVYEKPESIKIYANSHYVTPGPTLHQAINGIKKDLTLRLAEFRNQDKLLEAQRLEEKTKFDLEMMAATGVCAGIENYSRYLTGRAPGEPPPTLFEYLPKDALLFIDESHVAVPQVQGMYRGDQSRKLNLSEHGFRLPSCLDNRPLKFEEWDKLRPQTLFVSATPGPFELKLTSGVVAEQVIRPTGLVDPICEIRPCEHQVDDVMRACRETIAKGYRVLITTLTKKMAEALTDYLSELSFRVKYLHSDIDTLERIELLRDLRLGEYDILVGINLLREGLDIPECGLVCILDADKAGFLRSKSALIQTIGRAARNVEGYVLLYADRMSEALSGALEETERRRKKQVAYNEEHGITPQTIRKSIAPSLDPLKKDNLALEKTIDEFKDIKNIDTYIKKIEKQMYKAADDLDFEAATQLRDTLKRARHYKTEKETLA